jgi:hypothetical protein
MGIQVRPMEALAAIQFVDNDNPLIDIRDETEVWLHVREETLVVAVTRSLIGELFDAFYRIVPSEPDCHWCEDGTKAVYSVAMWDPTPGAEYGDVTYEFGCERHKDEHGTGDIARKLVICPAADVQPDTTPKGLPNG